MALNKENKMKKILGLFVVGMLFSFKAYAVEYTANYWASTTSVSNINQTQWAFPYNSRTITVMNGSTTPVWVSFGTANSIAQNGTSVVVNQASNGNNKVFMLPGSQFTTFSNLSQDGINLRSTGAAASPVSVIVAY